MEDLKRSQRHPAKSSFAEAYSNMETAKPEESHQRRAPVVVRIDRSRPPAPAIACAPEPAAVMVWRPAPWVIAHPGPAIPVFPNPPAITIRGPIGAYCGAPNRTVVGRVYPPAVGIQVLSPINVRAYMVIAGGPAETL